MIINRMIKHMDGFPYLRKLFKSVWVCMGEQRENFLERAANPCVVWPILAIVLKELRTVSEHLGSAAV